MEQLEDLFTQILLVAAQMELTELGDGAMDGSKFKANASKHKAMSGERACQLEDQLSREVAELLEKAEAADRQDNSEDSLPEELERRQTEQETDKKTPGPKPKPPESGPRDKDQVNFTDSESRMMLTSNNGWQQAWNGQATVDMDSHLITGGPISQAPNDKQQLTPALRERQTLPEQLGTLNRIAADNGYYSEDNSNEVPDQKITPYLATGRQKHNRRWDECQKAPALPPEDATEAEQMGWRLKTPEGNAFYGRRKATVETVFGIIKQALGFRQFMLWGIQKVAGEWNLVKCAYNLKRRHALAG